MRDVHAARNARGVSASAPYASAVHTESYPRRSASWTRAVGSARSAPDHASRASPSNTAAPYSWSRSLLGGVPASRSLAAPGSAPVRSLRVSVDLPGSAFPVGSADLELLQLARRGTRELG